MKPIKWYLQGFRNPRKGLWVIIERFCEKYIKNDKVYLSIKYYLLMGQRLHWKNPQTFNEKLNWLKVYDRKPEYTDMVDKIKAKEYVANRIGEEYIIPTYAVWDKPEDIDFDSLPNQFVLKCNHAGSLGMCICKDKSKLDYDKVREGLAACLKDDYYLHSREWPYKNVEKKIFAEALLEDGIKNDLPDYKIHCFNNGGKVILVCQNRFGESGLTEDFYDENWNHLDIRRPKTPNVSDNIQRPIELKKMLSLADCLSKEIPFLRVDFYYVNSRIYFGELTFFPAGASTPFDPSSVDYEWGSWITLPK